MKAKQGGLGRGLGSLFNEFATTAEVKNTETPAPVIEPQPFNKIPVNVIKRNPWQPRHHFTPETLAELVQSVRDHGILQPLLVRKVPDGYELIAGERRLTAAREVGLSEVPAIILEATDQFSLEIALIENLQREDLNIIEEAEGYRLLCDKFGMTQDQAAQRVGKARATVTNALRLLTLPEKLKGLIAAGTISAGHAKVLLGITDPKKQEELAQRAVAEGLSVRALENLINATIVPAQRTQHGKRRAPPTGDIPASHLRDITERLQRQLGTAVHITPTIKRANGQHSKGKVEIEFYDNDDLDRLLGLLGMDNG